MSVFATTSAGESKSDHSRSARKRTVKVVSTFLLAATFVLAGATSALADPPPPCRGDVPGVCPLQ